VHSATPIRPTCCGVRAWWTRHEHSSRRRNGAAWEAPLIENPALVRIDGRYVLLYSGGWWESDGYATGYATCDSPLGPCAKATTRHPLHTSDSKGLGPGGACVITAPVGDIWLAHHAWTPGAIGYRHGGARSSTSPPYDGTGPC
jgi:hypothetical protein